MLLCMKAKTPVRDHVCCFPEYSVIDGKAVPGPGIWLQASKRVMVMTLAEARDLRRSLSYMIGLVSKFPKGK